LEATRIALDLGGDVHAADPDGNTALHAAVLLGYPAVVDLLIEHGARLDAKNSNDQSPQDLMCFDADGRLVRGQGRRGSCTG
jgi:ankyrin repeat protein